MDAVEDLGRAGLRDDAEAVVLSVGEVWLPAPSSYGLVDVDAVSHAVLIREASEIARAGEAALRETFPGWTVRAETRTGSPAREILAYAVEWKPDLIALGSHGRTGITKFFLGSVSQKVAAEAECSVRVVRRRRAGEGPPRPLLALDGSLGAEFALRAVADRAWPEGTEVRVVTATGPMALDGSGVKEEIERVRAFQAEAVATLEAAGLAASTAIQADDPRQLLLREASDWRADCIFVGATGFVSLERALFGTVVAAVTARAPCSVEVIRPRR
jgi:nucleotide-binding universal stress UspA family protein